MNRANYENLLLQLFEDRWLGSKETDAGLDMNVIFNSKRNRRSPVTEADLAEFKELHEDWVRHRDRRRR